MKYEEPMVEIIELGEEDVICASTTSTSTPTSTPAETENTVSPTAF